MLHGEGFSEGIWKGVYGMGVHTVQGVHGYIRGGGGGNRVGSSTGPTFLYLLLTQLNKSSYSKC